jgi:membrane protein DedA with SNARE-associated domain
MWILPGIPETQLALAMAIFIATFIYEDGATLLAATLSASGRLDPVLGIGAAFLGIWVGDIGLYALGRLFRTSSARWPRLQRALKPEVFKKAEGWLAQNASLALAMSRAIPGSRLPLYLAAGALGLPLRRFARITAICAAAWVLVIFGIWRWLPTLWPGSGMHLPVALTVILLAAPWLLGKRLRPFISAAKKGEPASNQGRLNACAL